MRPTLGIAVQCCVIYIYIYNIYTGIYREERLVAAITLHESRVHTLFYFVFKKKATSCVVVVIFVSHIKSVFQSDTGLETHSVFGEDPLFVAPELGDFNVSADSPAIALGYHNFDCGATAAGLSPPGPIPAALQDIIDAAGVAAAAGFF